jgi:hypothetical protein
MRKQATGWGKIFAKHISKKRLVSKICKELSKLNNFKNRHGKTCLTSNLIKALQMKTTRYYTLSYKKG